MNNTVKVSLRPYSIKEEIWNCIIHRHCPEYCRTDDIGRVIIHLRKRMGYRFNGGIRRFDDFALYRVDALSRHTQPGNKEKIEKARSHFYFLFNCRNIYAVSSG